MDLKDIARQAKDMPDWKIEREFKEFFIKNKESFRYLDDKNKEVIFGLIDSYKDKARRGVHPSAIDIRRDVHNLWRQRLDLGLRENDLDLIKDILSSFKK